jgi:hypothetical protein
MSDSKNAALHQVSRYLGVKDFANFRVINRATATATADTNNRIRAMAQDNGWHSNLPPQLRKNFWNEIETIKALVDSSVVKHTDVVVWGEAKEEQKNAVCGAFESAEYKPDAIISGRPADFFTSNLPDPAKMPESMSAEKKAEAGERKAIEALKISIPKEVRDKWRHYGPNTIAVVNVSDFPVIVTSKQIRETLLSVAEGRKGTHSLWFVRGYEAVVVF